MWWFGCSHGSPGQKCCVADRHGRSWRTEMLCSRSSRPHANGVPQSRIELAVKRIIAGRCAGLNWLRSELSRQVTHPHFRIELAISANYLGRERRTESQRRIVSTLVGGSTLLESDTAGLNLKKEIFSAGSDYVRPACSLGQVSRPLVDTIKPRMFHIPDRTKVGTT